MKEQFELNQYFRVLETAGEDETEAKTFLLRRYRRKSGPGEKLVDGQDLIGLKYVQYVVHLKI